MPLDVFLNLIIAVWPRPPPARTLLPDFPGTPNFLQVIVEISHFNYPAPLKAPPVILDALRLLMKIR